MKGLIQTSIRRRVTVSMFTIAVLLFGFVSFARLKINLLPELSYPTLTIRSEYSGAAPAEVENLISKPIEEAVGVVKNMQKVSSVSRSGQSDVVLEFAWGTDMDYAVMEVREKMDSLQLPLEVRRPTILRFDPTFDPVMRFCLYLRAADGKKEKIDAGRSGQGFDEEKLKILRRFADVELKKELEAALGVAAVKISGGLEDEIQILVDQGKVAQLKLSLESIAAVLRAENINLSGGRLEEGSHQFLVRTLNQFSSVEEIANVIVSYQEGTPVYLRDVAQVQRGFKERQAITRVQGHEAVEIAIYKEGDANTVSVAREVGKRLLRLDEILPKDMALEKVYDQSTFIRQAVSGVIGAAWLGGLLAIIILYFFLRNFWSTVIIALSIPVSVVATFNLMLSSHLTLNIMSLGGIALGVGMLVDNSIVVLDNIARHRDLGKGLIDAAREGTGEVGKAVAASTLTTVAVFFPLVFVKGIAGQLFRDQALTITFSLLASLLVAMTLIPMLAAYEFKKEIPPSPQAKEPRTLFGRGFRKARIFLFTKIPLGFLRLMKGLVRILSRGLLFLLNPLLNGFSRAYARIESAYPRLISWALDHKGTVLGVSILMFAVSLVMIPFMGIELIPQLSQGQFRIEFRLPPGTPLEQTDAVIARAQLAAGNMPHIQNLFSVAGSGNRFDANPEQSGENWGELNVTMKAGSNRRDEDGAMALFRKQLQGVPGLQYKFSRPALFTLRTPVEVEIAGYDLYKLEKISGQIAGRMRSSNRFQDVKSTLEKGYPEIQIRFDRERAAALGLNIYDVADRVVRKVRGEVASRYAWRDRKIDMLVRVREQDRASVEDVKRLVINPESARPVTLSAVADIQVGTGPSEIRRVDQERVALVSANLNFGDLGAAAAELNGIILASNLPDDLSARVSGQNQEMKVSFRSLQFALLLAVFLVYLVMASQFESFLHPLVILFTIPLALIGAVFALFISGHEISVLVFLGAILLAGIVVNNAIVLVDFINQMRERGVEKRQAIIESGRSRLRPILITTMTTVLGLMPMAFGIGEGAEVRAPLAITVIGGLAMSTLLTLVLIPVVYSIMDRKQ